MILLLLRILDQHGVRKYALGGSSERAKRIPFVQIISRNVSRQPFNCDPLWQIVERDQWRELAVPPAEEI